VLKVRKVLRVLRVLKVLQGLKVRVAPEVRSRPVGIRTRPMMTRRRAAGAAGVDKTQRVRGLV